MILCDYHHGELYESLLKLFEDRLGGKVYRPIGADWHTEGWWIMGNDAGMIQQYLGDKFSIETGGGFWVNDVLVPALRNPFLVKAHQPRGGIADSAHALVSENQRRFVGHRLIKPTCGNAQTQIDQRALLQIQIHVQRLALFPVTAKRERLSFAHDLRRLDDVGNLE